MNLGNNEVSAITAYQHHLAHLLANSLCELWLFGSKARGDSHADSDIDLLVVSQNLDSETRSRIHKLAARCSLENDVIINTFLLSKKRWEDIKRHDDTLWREVERDGVLLASSSLEATH